MDIEVVDSDGYHDNAVNNSRITFPVGGPHLVMGAPQWYNPGFTCYHRLAKNGSATGYQYTTDGFAAGPTALSGTTPFWLENFSSGDYMEVQTTNDGGGTDSARAQMCALAVSDWSCMVGATGSSAASPQTFGTTIYDPHGMVTSSTTITVQRNGYYLILTIFDGNTGSYIYKNGAVLNGSYAEGQGACDYAVGFFSVGDTIQMVSGGTMASRQMAVIFLGGNTASLAYTYLDYDLHNYDADWYGYIRSNVEYIDTGRGHPKDGFIYNPGTGKCTSCGIYGLLSGYHFALSKVSTDGGTFLTNDGTHHNFNGVQMGNIFSTNRHQRGSHTTNLGFSCFASSLSTDTFAGMWLASDTYTASAYTPYTNVFVTDVGPVFTPHIYRRTR
jgi:hypothetical protein